MTIQPAALVLSDGSVFEGEMIGAQPADGIASGEVVFNTVLSGYQEVVAGPISTSGTAMLASTRRKRPAEAKRRLVVHADDDTVAVSDKTYGLFRRGQFVRVAITPGKVGGGCHLV